MGRFLDRFGRGRYPLSPSPSPARGEGSCLFLPTLVLVWVLVSVGGGKAPPIIKTQAPTIRPNNPAVEESTPSTCPSPRIHPSVSTASFLPISTPHWSNGLISQITDCTNTLCSYIAISAPRLRGVNSSSNSVELG